MTTPPGGADPLVELRRRIEKVRRENPLPRDDGQSLRRLLTLADLRRRSPGFRAVVVAFLRGDCPPAQVRRHPEYRDVLAERLAGRGPTPASASPTPPAPR